VLVGTAKRDPLIVLLLLLLAPPSRPLAQPLPRPLAQPLPRPFAQTPAPHELNLADPAGPAQYAFLSPLLKDVEVVSLAESIHMTHEFPIARIGMVRWMNQHLGFAMLAIEGSPEDLWVSQDALLRDPTDLADSTSGLFGVWNTAEMRELFAYEASTWQTGHPLYITAYDIQPGTGRASPGQQVFRLLAQSLVQYAPPPAAFDEQAWADSLSPLTRGCGQFAASDAAKVDAAIALLQGWIDRAAPVAQKAFPALPHAAALRMIPENLRSSLALCEGFQSGGASGAGLYKTTRDRNAAQFALRLKEIAPGGRLILWAHVSHLFYDAEATSTSVGEILHASLGSRLYTIGAFAQAGGALMLFSDWDDIVGYGRVWGVSSALKQELGENCGSVCFFDLRHRRTDSPLSTPQRVWFEATPRRLALASDFDGIVWVKHVHPPRMTLWALAKRSSPRYWGILLGLTLGLAAAGFFLAIALRWMVRPRGPRSISARS
jgi:erythromycin esterase-like protein